MSAVLAAVPKSPLAGVNILVEGPTGTGKTTSLKTLADAGLEVFVLFTESGLESFAGIMAKPQHEDDDDASPNWAYTKTGKRYLSAMPQR